MVALSSPLFRGRASMHHIFSCCLSCASLLQGAPRTQPVRGPRSQWHHARAHLSLCSSSRFALASLASGWLLSGGVCLSLVPLRPSRLLALLAVLTRRSSASFRSASTFLLSVVLVPVIMSTFAFRASTRRRRPSARRCSPKLLLLCSMRLSAAGTLPVVPPPFARKAWSHSLPTMLRLLLPGLRAGPGRSWRWKGRPHINIESAALLCQRLAKDGPWRFVVLIESSVALNSAAKGRSPSRGLAPVLRKIAATCLAAGLYVSFHFCLRGSACVLVLFCQLVDLSRGLQAAASLSTVAA